MTVTGEAFVAEGQAGLLKYTLGTAGDRSQFKGARTKFWDMSASLRRKSDKNRKIVSSKRQNRAWVIFCFGLRAETIGHAIRYSCIKLWSVGWSTPEIHFSAKRNNFVPSFRSIPRYIRLFIQLQRRLSRDKVFAVFKLTKQNKLSNIQQ